MNNRIIRQLFRFYSRSTSTSESSTLSPEEVSPAYVVQNEIIRELLVVANSQIAAGDLAGATSTLLEIEARNPNSKEAKLLSLKISRALDNVQSINLYKTRENMLNAVNNNWEA